ncbi:hypothetical protein KM043_013149 [Ampulex compressa]|nr:hypothetical protein KM043_013149 [Ampulex compressa]
MEDTGDKVLDEEQWKLEAKAVINDVKQHVADIRVSEKLQNSNRYIYLNLTTLEGLKFCIKMSGAGFTIVANQHDAVSKTDNEYFETPYSLLDFISPQYRNSFGNSLLDKLKELSDQQF